MAGLALFGLAGCTAVLAGAAAGMLAARPSTEIASATVQTPTAGDSIDRAADTAGATLARTIKENVPASVRSVPTGAPKVVAVPPVKPVVKPVVTPVAPAPTVIKQTERIHDDINSEGASR